MGIGSHFIGAPRGLYSSELYHEACRVPSPPPIQDKCVNCGDVYLCSAKEDHERTPKHLLSIGYYKCIICDEFVHVNTLEEHKNTSLSHKWREALVKCDSCGILYHPVFESDHVDSWEHEEALRKSEEIICYLCNEKYHPFISDEDHIMSELHQKAVWISECKQCELCEQYYHKPTDVLVSNNAERTIKMYSNFSSNRWECKQKYLPIKHSFSQKHKIALREINGLLCEDCGELFLPEETQIHIISEPHIRRVARRYGIYCSICDQYYLPAQKDFHFTSSNHIDAERIYCKICWIKYHPVKELLSHEQTKTHRNALSNQKIYCEHCNQTLIRKNFAKHCETKKHLMLRQKKVSQ